MIRELSFLGTAALILTACSGGDEPDAGPSDGGFQIQGPVLVAQSADTFPVAIDQDTFKVAYTSESKLYTRDLDARETLDSNGTIDRRFKPLFDPAWSQAIVVRDFDGVNEYVLSAIDFAAPEPRAPRELTTSGRTAPQRSGDGLRVLYLVQGSGIPELRAFDLSTKTERKLGARANNFHVVAGSTKVVYTGEDELHVVDVLTAEDHRISDFTSMAHAGPGASKILFYSATQTLQLLDVLTEQLTMLATDASEAFGNAEVSADQRYAIFAREEITGRALYRLDTANPAPERIFAYTEEARISRDGRTVVLWTFVGPANLFVWTNGEATLINRYFIPSGGPRFDDDMKYVAYFSTPDPVTNNVELRFYDVVRKNDVSIHEDADTRSMRMANDGARVAFFTGDGVTYGPLAVWERASHQTTAIAPRALRALVAKKDLSAIAFSEEQTTERVSLWTVRDSSPSVIAEQSRLESVKLDPSERRIVFANGADLWLDVLDDTTPPALFARFAAEEPVFSESLIAYAVRAGTSTASGVYVQPLP